MNKSWGHLCLKCILSLFLGSDRLTHGSICVSSCAKGLRRRCWSVNWSSVTHLWWWLASLNSLQSFCPNIRRGLSSGLSPHLIPPSCEVSGYVFVFFDAYLIQTQMYLVLYESHMFVYVRYCRKILPTPFTTISKTPAIFAPPGCLWIIMSGHFVMDMWSARIKKINNRIMHPILDLWFGF